MPLPGIDRLTGLILCLGGLSPGHCPAAPDLARTTATVSARILASVSLSVDSTANTLQTSLTVSNPDKQVYQLQIDNALQHSMTQANAEQPSSLPATENRLKLAQNLPTPVVVTLYFN